MVSHITVLPAQEIFVYLIHITYRHCEVSGTAKKAPHSRRGTASLQQFFPATSKQRTPLGLTTERSEQGELQAQGSGSHHRYYQRHTNELQTRLSISTACFPMEWLAASQLHFKLTIIIWTNTYFPPPKWKGQTTTSTLFISTKLMQHLENRVQSKNLARREKSPYYLLFILLSFTPKPTITQTESPKCRKEAHDHH